MVDGTNSSEDRAVPLILDAAAEHDLKVTFLIEPGFASVIEARSWIVYLIDTYGDHPAFHRAPIMTADRCCTRSRRRSSKRPS